MGEVLARQAAHDGARLQAHDHEREHVQYETAVSQTEYVLTRLRADPRYDACCESVMP